MNALATVFLVLIGLAVACSALLVAIAAYVYATGRLDERRRRRRPLTDREVMDALAPFGADISIWPSRAPRNGSTSEVE